MIIDYTNCYIEYIMSCKEFTGFKWTSDHISRLLRICLIISHDKNLKVFMRRINTEIEYRKIENGRIILEG